MTDFWKFWYDSPFLSLMAIWGTCELLTNIFFRLPNRVIRHLNIRKHGWPPEHLDADGDFKKEEKEDE
jgi:hypothetical protein